mmetsp:Transcript_26884/g.104340  ORF Transcript_26884/g.104340 Transcript_26884/m.104340 type:complete len:82 (+) Transcript_26884:1905-2150(+)
MLQEIWRAAVYLKDTVRASIYDAFIVSFTAKWYSAVLNRLPEGAHILGKLWEFSVRGHWNWDGASAECESNPRQENSGDWC